jgi:hypothetical protein
LAAAEAFPDHADDAVAGVPDSEGVESVKQVSVAVRKARWD